MTGPSRPPDSDDVMLLCLDAVSLAADSDAEPRDGRAAWSTNAAGLLAHARAHGWPVGHVLSRRRGAGETAWRPMAGLSPQPAEPVYHREKPSAFSSPELCAALTGRRRWEVVLCGASLRGSGLATALDALRLTLRLTIVDDATWLTPAERDGLDGLLQLQRMGLASGGVRLAQTDTLLRPWPRLRLVQGGRA